MRVVRHHPTDISHAFFSTMLVRRLDASGYARVKHWRVYAEEGLARREVAVWLGNGEMALEYGARNPRRPDALQQTLFDVYRRHDRLWSIGLGARFDG